MAIEVANIPEVLDLQHGKQYHDCLEGRVFSQTTTPLGLAIPIYTATALAGGLPIWNPSNSKVNVELIRVLIAKASGTSDFFSVVLMARSNLGADLATGSQITAFAATTPKNGLLGAGFASQVKSSNAGTCTVTAGAAGEAIWTLFGTGVAADATASDIAYFDQDIDGAIIVPPGTMVWLAATKASVALYCSTIVWKEIPL